MHRLGRHFKLLSQINLGYLTGVVVLFGLIVYSYVGVTRLEQAAVRMASTTAAHAANLAALEETLTAKTVALADKEYALEQSIAVIQERLGGFEQRVGTISGTLGVLEKLSKTDPELLQKYSKVFFLNEHYTPERLSLIDSPYIYNDGRMERIHALVFPKLMALLQAATSSGITLYVKSAYRSFDEQDNIKSAYSVTYGAGTANSFSADQGYSEHQLGTTLDFITTGLNGQLSGFEKTAAYAWLVQNAHQFGFILSYPPNNSYYIFEPWHWRFVGVPLATYLKNNGLNFYDLEQRTIDTYLATIFD